MQKGNVFTSVCQELCPSGVCTPACSGQGGSPPWQTPQWAGGSPPWQTPQSSGQTPPGHTSPVEMTIEAGGTHATGMNSCLVWLFGTVAKSPLGKLLEMPMLASKDFRVATNSYLQWRSTWWSLDQELNPYPVELAWHALVSLILLDPDFVMFYWF